MFVEYPQRCFLNFSNLQFIAMSNTFLDVFDVTPQVFGSYVLYRVKNVEEK